VDENTHDKARVSGRMPISRSTLARLLQELPLDRKGMVRITDEMRHQLIAALAEKPEQPSPWT
jgi:DNA-binding transcriptional regulator LsrR (DeoR family)